MAVITVSSEFGAGGPAVGKRLAERLQVDYLDNEIIQQIALGLDVSQEEVEAFDEARHNRLRSFLSTVFDFDALKKTSVDPEEASGDTFDDRDEIPYQFRVKGWIDRDLYKEMMVKVVSAVGIRGGAVIKGRGGQWILKDNPRAIHVRFVADLEDRVARTMERRKLSRDKARALVAKMDKRGEEFVRSYFGVDMKEPTLYHLVLNSSKIPLDTCLDLLETLARSLPLSEGP